MHKEEVLKIRKIWDQLAFQYTGDKVFIKSCWEELVELYSSGERYYHNLDHIYTVIRLIEDNQFHLLNYHALLFAAFYHDAIYDVARKDNEALSAQLAGQRLRELAVDKSIAILTIKIIQQTATHQKTGNFDIDLFLDLDRYILSSSEAEYAVYKEQIRKEYGIFSDRIFSSVRAKLLRTYLSSSEIYYTAIMKGKEKDARRNLERELQELTIHS